MFAAQSHTGLLNEFARAVSSIGRAVAMVFSADPAPYWTDYLRETDRRAR
jgi:hypothetical protein